MGISRRGFLGRTIASTLAAPEIAKAAAEVAASTNALMPPPGIGLAKVLRPPDIPMPSVHAGEKHPLYSLWRKTNHRSDQRRMWRVNGFDPDIDSLRSFSLHAKIRMQIARDEQEMEFLEWLRKQVWG